MNSKLEVNGMDLGVTSGTHDLRKERWDNLMNIVSPVSGQDHVDGGQRAGQRGAHAQ